MFQDFESISNNLERILDCLNEKGISTELVLELIDLNKLLKSSHDFWKSLDSGINGLVVDILTGDSPEKEELLRIFKDSKREFDIIRSLLNDEAIKRVKSEIG